MRDVYLNMLWQAPIGLPQFRQKFPRGLNVSIHGIHLFRAGQYLRAVLNKFLGMSTRAAGKFPLRRLTKVQPKPLSIVEVQHGKSCSKMNSGHPCFRSHGNHYCGFGVAAATA